MIQCVICAIKIRFLQFLPFCGRSKQVILDCAPHDSVVDLQPDFVVLFLQYLTATM